METGVAHHAAGAPPACPPDTYSQSSCCALQLQAPCLSPSLLPPSSSLFLCPRSNAFIPFWDLLLSKAPFSVSPSFITPPMCSQWQLSLDSFLHFYFSPPQRENSRASGALFKQTGGCVVRPGWRHAITNHRLLAVACTHCTGPLLRRAGAKRDLPCRCSWQPDSNIRRSEVRSDGGWELRYWTTWSDGLLMGYRERRVRSEIASGDGVSQDVSRLSQTISCVMDVLHPRLS